VSEAARASDQGPALLALYLSIDMTQAAAPSASTTRVCPSPSGSPPPGT